MPNLLTGDFEAVLQVSGGTINRLLASMHQNAFANPKVPSFPHSVRIRIGDDYAIDGVRGRVDAQVGVPRVELIHGVTDRFILEVSVRVRYRPDPGTAAFPAFIQGTIRAEYRIEDIDPSCVGWAKTAADYIWVRVVKDSVQFHGTAEDDVSAFVGISGAGGSAAAQAANVAKVNRQVAALLATRFVATPHPVSQRFRRGSLRSLNVPLSGSAVAMPIGLSGEPVGAISSIDNVVLEDADMAVGVSLDYIMSLMQPALDAVKGFSQDIWVHVSTPWPAPDINTVYRVRVDPPAVQWQPQGSYALINVKVHGSATTDSIAADATFDVEQNVTLNFDSGPGRLWLAPGTPHVTVHSSGLYHGTVAGAVRDGVYASVKAIVEAACSQAQPTLDAMTTRTQPLVEQLQTLDAGAGAGLDDAAFLPDGIVLRGTIALSGRHAPVVEFEKTAEQDGHSALQSWIPGGRIDRFEWSWTWFATRENGKATYDDRFLLRRPRGAVSRWGGALELTMPLPGIDGWGDLCLKIKGVQVDPVTGQLVAVETTRQCTRFGFNIYDRLRERLVWRDMPELSQDVPFPQLSVVRAGGAHVAAEAANTLLVYLDEAWDERTAAALSGGLERCARYDAGLALLVLFREGLLAHAGTRVIAEVERFAEELGIAAIVNEDVRGSWSRAFGLRSASGQPGWCLLSPEGAATWTHLGGATPELLASALDTHLHRSPQPVPVAIRPTFDIGAQLDVTALHPGSFDPVESRCPPPPLGRGGRATVVTFVQRGSGSSEAQLRTLFRRYGQRDDEGPLVMVVVDGADTREAEALKHELGLDFVTVPDPTGSITDRFGVGIWPTTVTLDRAGTVSGVQIGAAAGRL